MDRGVVRKNLLLVVVLVGSALVLVSRFASRLWTLSLKVGVVVFRDDDGLPLVPTANDLDGRGGGGVPLPPLLPKVVAVLVIILSRNLGGVLLVESPAAVVVVVLPNRESTSP